MYSRRISFYRAFLPVALLVTGLFLLDRPLFADDFNWENIGGQSWLTSIKDQASTGACWDFATCGALEEKYMLTRNDNTFQPDISEQHMVCDGSCGNDEGGYQDQAMSYLTTNGVVSEAELPFTYSDTSPNWPLARAGKTASSSLPPITNHLGTNIATIKNDLKKYGPLVLFMQADNDWYIPSPGTYRGNHSIQIVGYHDNVGSETLPAAAIGSSRTVGERAGTPPGRSTSTTVTAPWIMPPVRNPPPTSTRLPAGVLHRRDAVRNLDRHRLGRRIWTTSMPTHRNWSSGLAWVNQETAATFDATGQPIEPSRSLTRSSPTGLIFNAGPDTRLNNGSSGALTVTAGGIQANQSVTINVPVTVGAPQTWTTASGMTLNVTGAVHTIISDLTIDGAGNTTIGGPIDGGGVINTYGGAAPGNLIKSGTGTLTLSGASNYPGTITVNAGVLSLSPVSGATATYSGAISGSGAHQKNGLGTVVLSAANSAFPARSRSIKGN